MVLWGMRKRRTRRTRERTKMRRKERMMRARMKKTSLIGQGGREQLRMTMMMILERMQVKSRNRRRMSSACTCSVQRTTTHRYSQCFSKPTPQSSLLSKNTLKKENLFVFLFTFYTFVNTRRRLGISQQ